MKPIVTRLGDLTVFGKYPVYGKLYTTAFLPFVEGKITLRNLTNIDIEYAGQHYTLRVDRTLSKALGLTMDKPQLADELERLLHYQQHLLLLGAQWSEKGLRLLKDVKDLNSAVEAITNTTPAYRRGITIVTSKRINQLEQDPENGVVYLHDIKLPIISSRPTRYIELSQISTDDLLILLGSYVTVKEHDSRQLSEFMQKDFVTEF